VIAVVLARRHCFKAGYKGIIGRRIYRGDPQDLVAIVLARRRSRAGCREGQGISRRIYKGNRQGVIAIVLARRHCFKAGYKGIVGRRIYRGNR
jgi:hypothetical protein